ncbi:unnamed protein product [Staurois parvus]|uniref:Uncharacterized protein n=2 Tax=Staurois parvus TaxID=386267 RepID=A0ABN9GM40_9NEOB|nr:unnamed protein product [Staurois parvus]
MTRDCGHSTGDDQRLRTQYRRCPETVDILQEMTRDCGHSTDDQRLRICRDDQRLKTFGEQVPDSTAIA